MKNLYIMHGDKGGVGKSMMASLLIDYLFDQQPLVVEGDMTIPDVASRYQDSGIPGLGLDLARSENSETAILELFSEIEISGQTRHVIINAPASASGTLDAQADLLVPVALEMGYRVIVAWLVGPGDESARLAERSALCAAAHHKVAIVNRHLCGQANPVWHRHPVRNLWLDSGGQEAELPALNERIAHKVRDTTGRFSDLLSPDAGLQIAERHGLKRWLDRCFEGPCASLMAQSEVDHD